MMGSAYKNKGVQLLLDGVTEYLPNPNGDHQRLRRPRQERREGHARQRFGQAPRLPRVQAGGRPLRPAYLPSHLPGNDLQEARRSTNTRTGKRHKVGRLVRMHADEMEDIDSAGAGDIVAMFGVDCTSGDTFTDGTLNVAMTSMFVPDRRDLPDGRAQGQQGQANLSKALSRFTKEDPTFRVRARRGDRRDHHLGHGRAPPRHLHRAHEARVRVRGHRRPAAGRLPRDHHATRRLHLHAQEADRRLGPVRQGCRLRSSRGAEAPYRFDDQITGGAIPREFIPAVDKGFQSMLAKGALIGAPVTGVSVTINDGASHAVDSSDIAFQEAARGAWREAYPKAGPPILEPLMKVAVEGPSEFQGGIVGILMQRRGIIVGTSERDGFSRVDAEVPLADMFGFSTIFARPPRARPSSRWSSRATLRFRMR